MSSTTPTSSTKTNNTEKRIEPSIIGYSWLEQQFLNDIRTRAERYLNINHSKTFDEQKAKHDLSDMFYHHYIPLYESGELWLEPEVKVDVKPVLYPNVGYFIDIEVRIVEEGIEKTVNHQFILRPLKDRATLINTYLN